MNIESLFFPNYIRVVEMLNYLYGWNVLVLWVIQMKMFLVFHDECLFGENILIYLNGRQKELGTSSNRP